jgi:hypothetical protein
MVLPLINILLEISSAFVLLHMLALEGMFVGARGEEAAQLGGVCVHGRVRAQDEAEELEFHVNVAPALRKS